MSTELKRREPALTGDLILPEPKNSAAVAIRDKMDLMLALLPSGTESKQFAISALTEINKLDSDVNVMSICVSVANCAALGLVPGPALGHAYFVPYKRQCTLIVGYKGFLDLAFTNRFLAAVHTDVVLAEEPFEYWKDVNGPQLKHDTTNRILDEVQPTIQNIRAAYCLYRTSSGFSGVKFVSGKKIKQIYQKASDKSPWKTGDNYEEMSLKTAVRRAAKEWKVTPRLARAVMLDEQAERGEPQMADGLDVRGLLGGRVQVQVPGDYDTVDEPPPPEPAADLPAETETPVEPSGEPTAPEAAQEPVNEHGFAGPPSASELLRDRINDAQTQLELDAIRRDIAASHKAKQLTEAQRKALQTKADTKRIEDVPY